MVHDFSTADVSRSFAYLSSTPKVIRRQFFCSSTYHKFTCQNFFSYFKNKTFKLDGFKYDTCQGMHCHCLQFNFKCNCQLQSIAQLVKVSTPNREVRLGIGYSDGCVISHSDQKLGCLKRSVSCSSTVSLPINQG